MSHTLPHDHIVPFKSSTEAKKNQVANMFNAIAKRYDFLNRLLSMGIDVRWRKKAIQQLKMLQPQFVLDVATGTADVALLTYQLLHPQKIIGIDISEGMLAIGRKKIEAAALTNTILLQAADSELLPFANETFDAITVAFGVRNFEHLQKGLSEMLRVLKPGGKAVILECSKPKTMVLNGLFQLYMKIITPNIGRMIAKNKEAYQYLNNSVQAFPEGSVFVDILQSVGFNQVYKKPLSFGVCTIYVGTK